MAFDGFGTSYISQAYVPISLFHPEFIQLYGNEWSKFRNLLLSALSELGVKLPCPRAGGKREYRIYGPY